MASYRPQLKTSNGVTDLPLDAETVKGKTILEQTYPVGAIYISTNNTSPASLFGGTWAQLKDTFLLAHGDTYTSTASATPSQVSAEAGEATHQLTTDEIPSHSHDIGLNTSNSVKLGWGSGSSYAPNLFSIAANGTDTTGNKFIALNSGGGGAHNNMPPYLTVYMWKRTA
jgi:microcystin-dependent protein